MSEDISNVILNVDSNLQRASRTSELLKRNVAGLHVLTSTRLCEFPGEKSAIERVRSQNGTAYHKIVVNSDARKFEEFITEAILQFEEKGYTPGQRIIVIGSCLYEGDFGIKVVPACGGGFIDPNNSQKINLLKQYLQ